MSQDPFLEREAEKYESPIPSREYILAHLAKRETPASREELGNELGLSGEEQLEAEHRDGLAEAVGAGRKAPELHGPLRFLVEQRRDHRTQLGLGLGAILMPDLQPVGGTRSGRLVELGVGRGPRLRVGAEALEEEPAWRRTSVNATENRATISRVPEGRG